MFSSDTKKAFHHWFESTVRKTVRDSSRSLFLSLSSPMAAPPSLIKKPAFRFLYHLITAFHKKHAMGIWVESFKQSNGTDTHKNMYKTCFKKK